MSPHRGWSERAWDKRLLDYAYLCTEDALEPELFDECVEMLIRDYDTIVAIVDYDGTGNVASIYQGGVGKEQMGEYQGYYYRRNVFAHAVQRYHLENITTSFDRYVPGNELHDSEYYNDFLRRLRVEHALALSLCGAHGERTSISLYRGDHNGGEFDREEARRFDRLRPFLRGALTMRKLAAAASNGARCAHQDATDTQNAAEPLALVASAGSSDRLPSKWGLTARETEVALAVADGLSYKEVAFKLGISFHTVNAHIDSLHRKTGLSTAHLIAVLNRRATR
jgi:DNA-binding CsgD family transcriptional regulator